MINSLLFERWLTHSVAFANIPEPAGARAALLALRGPQRVTLIPGARKVRIGAGLGDLEPSRWSQPADGFPALHSKWRAWCADFVVTDDALKQRLRDQCIDWSMNDDGRELIVFQSAHVAPFGFDTHGTPQLGLVEATSPEGMLALVGAELLAPGCRLTIWRCTVCGKYHDRALDRLGRGQPRKTCEGCEPKSTPRVREYRRKLKLKRRNRK